MKTLFLTPFLLYSLFTFGQKNKPPKRIVGKEVIGYYPGWQVYDRERLVTPDKLNYRKLTTIIYAFFRPDFFGNIRGTDSFIDELVLKGQRDWRVHGQTAYIPSTSLVELAHYKKVKVLISIGGWTLSSQFGQIAADSSKRVHFAEECVRLVKEYDIDGIDIDWEFPNTTDFGLLLKEIRSAFSTYEKTIKPRRRKHLIVAIAASSAAKHINNIHWPSVLPFIDYVNVMTYDYTGSWTPKTGPKSPLYSIDSTQESIHQTITYYRDVAQVPDTMLNIGTAFNGNALACKEGKVEICQNHKRKYDTKTFKTDEGQPTYFHIKEKEGLFIEKWDSIARQPYLLGQEVNTFVTFDNERAVCEKVSYIKQQQLNGIFIWDITGDVIETKSGSGFVKEMPLLDAIYDCLRTE